MGFNLIPIDFEYNQTSEEKLNLVCAAFDYKGKRYSIWLHKDKTGLQKLKNTILKIRQTDEDAVFVAWNVIAEGQSFISLGIHPARNKWLDVQAEWKMLTNHAHKYMYGKQLIDGREVFTVPPQYGKDKTVNNSRPKTNLAAGCYKLLGVKIDTEHKDKMRDIIIRGNEQEIEENKEAILKYCESDLDYLLPMWEKIKSAYVELLPKRTFPDGTELCNSVKWEEVFWRGETMARTALITSLGYPVDVRRMRNLANNAKGLFKELCEDINSQFEYNLFNWNKKEDRYSKSTLQMKKLIKESEYADKWLRTKTGDFSLSVDAFGKMFSWRHDFPRGNPFAQYYRFLKTQRSLNGFIPKGANAKNKETIFDSLGVDERVRGYLNPYGSLSSRYQPKATSYIPLKSSWTRSLIAPKRGKAIAGSDFKSEEFLLGGLVSKCQNMLDAYASGDVYFYFAKLAGAVEWDAKREDNEDIRNRFKSTVLGISYLMGPESLARKLTDDTGVPHTVKDAQELISKFEKSFPEYTEWQNKAFWTYARIGSLKLPDGWIMFGDNPNERSVKNCPVQGFGGSILRKAIQLAQDAGLAVILPLHDALYIEYNVGEEHKIDTLLKTMREAFAFYFKGEMRSKAFELIKFDVNVWSPDYEDGKLVTPEGVVCKKQNVYIDERGAREYERFKKYLEEM